MIWGHTLPLASWTLIHHAYIWIIWLFWICNWKCKYVICVIKIGIFFNLRLKYGHHFLCWISGIVPFNIWLISSWEENECCYKMSKCTKWHMYIPIKMVELVILSVAHLVTTVIFFSAWDKSRVKWEHSQNSTQKMRTFVASSNLL